MSTIGSLIISLTGTTTSFERALGSAARSVKNTQREFQKSAREMESIGRSWSLGVTAPIIAGLTAVSKAAIGWQDDFAGVQKTVDATEQQFTGLDAALRKMSTEIPASTKELAGIAETAGQLGIQVQNIEAFTRTMAAMGTATNMASEDAATSLAQLDNIMQSGQASFDRYGSTVVKLGNRLATTESRIVEFGLNMAAAGKIAGLTEAQVLSVAGAFGSVGVEAEAGGTAVSKVLTAMTESVATGNKYLQTLAATAGMTSAEFATAWRDDSGEAFTRFVEGLGQSGDQAFAILRNLGLTDQRLLRGFLSVAGAGDLLRRSVQMGTEAWEENTALVTEAAARYKTWKSQLTMIGNRFSNVAKTVGTAFAPVLDYLIKQAKGLAVGLQRLADGFAALPAPVRFAIGAILLMLAAIGPLALAAGLLNRTIAGAIGVFGILAGFIGRVAFAFELWRASGIGLRHVLVYIAGGPTKLVILAIAALAVAAVYLAANWEKVAAIAKRVWTGIAAVVMYASSLMVRAIGYLISPITASAGQSLMKLADNLRSAASAALQSARATAEIAAQAESVSKTGDSAAKSQQDFADGLESAAKAAGKGLQSFDEVHLMEEQMTTTDMSIPEFEVPGLGLGDGLAGVGESLSSTIEAASANIQSAWAKMVEGIVGGIDKLRERFPLLNTVAENFAKAGKWIKDNWTAVRPILEGLAGVLLLVGGAWLIAHAPIAAFVAGALLVAAAASWVVANWETVGPWFASLWNGIKDIAGPAWEGIKSTLETAWANTVQSAKVIWDGLRSFWNQWGSKIIGIFRQLSDAATQIWSGIVETAKYLWGQLQAFWQQWGGAIKTAVGILFGAVVSIISEAINTVVAIWNSMVDTAKIIWGLLEDFWATWGDTITAMFGGVWRGLFIIVETAINLIKNVVLFALAVIRGDWAAAGKYLIDAAQTVWDFLVKSWQNLRQTASDIWNGILGVIKGVINGVIKAVNWMIKGLNQIKFGPVPDWIKYLGFPGLAGKTWGINIPLIPMLATGTNLVPQNTLAYLHAGEAVVPKRYNPAATTGSYRDDADEIAQAVYQAIMDASRMMDATRSNKPAREGDLVMKVDSRVLGRVSLAALQHEADRTGQSFVIRPQGA